MANVTFLSKWVNCLQNFIGICGNCGNKFEISNWIADRVATSSSSISSSALRSLRNGKWKQMWGRGHISSSQNEFSMNFVDSIYIMWFYLSIIHFNSIHEYFDGYKVSLIVVKHTTLKISNFSPNHCIFSKQILFRSLVCLLATARFWLSLHVS